MFFKTDVERTLDAIATVHNPENCTSQELKDCKLQELKHFRSQQLLISNGIKNIDVYLTGLADNPSKLADVQAAIALRQFLQAQKNEAVPPVGTNAFYLGSTMLLWPAFFALVGSHLHFSATVRSGCVTAIDVQKGSLSLAVHFHFLPVAHVVEEHPSWRRRPEIFR
jgi:hypothetical protein